MPKSRNTTLGSVEGSQSGIEDQEIAQRVLDRVAEPEPIRVEVFSSRSGGLERMDVLFTGNGMAQVNSGSGNTYHVNEVEESCTCLDYEHCGGRCRHMEGVALARGQEGQREDAESVQDEDIRLSELMESETVAEFQTEQELRERNRTDDAFFYTDNPEQFREDFRAAMEAPIPYDCENVLNGSNATFGIELEFVNGDSNAIARELYDLGICSTRSMAGYHSALTMPGKWKLERDSSVTSDERGGELVSPVLTDTPETWQQIEKICEVARRHGAEVNTKTGAHVHVGAEALLDGKRQRWRRFFKMSAGFENVLYRLSGGELGIFRGGSYANNSFSQSMGGINSRLPGEAPTYIFQQHIETIAESRYRSINLKPFSSAKKTVEFRAFNGTLSPGIIQGNVKFAVGMMESAERSRTQNHLDFEVTEADKRRGRIINEYEAARRQDDGAIMRVLDTVCCRREDKQHLLSVIVKNRWW